ncbi:MAG: hypothetical protein AABX08_03670 [Nanoarchaeota archaeon]
MTVIIHRYSNLKNNNKMSKNVIITNAEKLEKTKKTISTAGAKKFHVLSDFDRTLTKAFVNRKEVPSQISVLRERGYLSNDYATKAYALYNKYHPIEVDPKIPIKEKKAQMQAWWEAHFKLLIESGLNRRDLERVVESKKIKFRKGALELIDFLYKHNIPLVILSSSGLGTDAIRMSLDKKRRLYDNVYIVSNSFEWDEKGNAIGVKKPIIHGMNKDETVIQTFPFFNVIRHRTNVLLLGDSLSDVDMVKGFDYENLIRVGFLNKDIENSLEAYKRNFDIIILNDSPMDYVNDLIAGMFGQ